LVNLLEFHHYELAPDAFSFLKELDFSHNYVETQEDLFYTKNLKGLSLLNITGNPLA
jgi:Leucine-rich repeat (LRR) protein